jgi:hypothetical protein
LIVYAVLSNKNTLFDPTSLLGTFVRMAEQVPFDPGWLAGGGARRKWVAPGAASRS